MQKAIHTIGIPMDLGQNRRGVDMGPSAIRYAGLQPRLEKLGLTVVDYGNVPVPVPEEAGADNAGGRLKAVTTVSQSIYEFGRACFEKDAFALFLGGDHSVSIGTVTAAAQGETIGLIWVDAHGDFNTMATSPTGNIHGMPVSVLVGDGPEPLVNLGYSGPKLKPQQIVQVGIRNLDPPERKRLAASGITVFTMRHIDEVGIAKVARETLAKLAHVDRIHVSLDMDGLDPDVAPGVGTPVPGGLTYREAHLLMEILSEDGRVCSMDVVEINPILDSLNTTAEIAVELVASLLGQRIL